MDDGGWRLPTVDELKQIYENKDKGRLAGTFNDCSADNAKGDAFNEESDRIEGTDAYSIDVTYYWAMEGYAVDFKSGKHNRYDPAYRGHSMRFVRTEPRQP